MLKVDETRRIEKIIEKALKIVNKNFYKNKLILGRFIIRDCYHQIIFRLPEERRIVYCFECRDKETHKQKFFQMEIDEFNEGFSIDYFVKILHKNLESFSSNFVVIFEEDGNKRKVKDYRKIKID